MCRVAGRFLSPAEVGGGARPNSLRFLRGSGDAAPTALAGFPAANSVPSRLQKIVKVVIYPYLSFLQARRGRPDGHSPARPDTRFSSDLGYASRQRRRRADICMDFDPTLLMLSLIPSGLGFILFTYGRKQERWPQLLCGVLLMIYPYLANSITAMLGGGVLLCAALYTLLALGY
jgi:hypothetical protein